VQALSEVLFELERALAWWPLLIVGAEALALLTIPSVLLQRRGQPLAALAWVLALIALPLGGVLAWWAIGRSHLDRKRRRRRIAHDEFASSRPRDDDDARPARESDLLPLNELSLRSCDGVFPTVPGNRLLLLLDGGHTYRALERVVEAARRHLHFLFYSWAADEVGARFRDLLAEKARAGVEVRVLLDALGSASATGRFMEPLRRSGARVESFMPTRYLRRSLTVNFRNHRKIVVADGRVAYTGGSTSARSTSTTGATWGCSRRGRWWRISRRCSPTTGTSRPARRSPPRPTSSPGRCRAARA